MKKLFSIVASLLMTIVATAQTFSGIPLSGSVDVFKQRLTEKGFTYFNKFENGYTFKGRIGVDEVEVYVFHTTQGRLVTKVKVYFAKQYSFGDLVSDYEKKLKVLTTKFGEPQHNLDYFKSPYYYGDGYELQAVKTENYVRLATWDNNTNFPKLIQITEFLQVMVIYENLENVKIRATEIEQSTLNGL